MLVWKILICFNMALVLGLYGLVFLAVRNVKKKKKLATKVTVKQTSPKKV